jgi:hypothetical protein
MTQITLTRPDHPDVQVAHAVPGRIRLWTPRVRGRPQHAEDVERRLVAVPGVQRAHANPTTGSVTVHYHPSALESAEFFTEVAAGLGLVASGLEPSQVESMFRLLGVSPEDVRAAWGGRLWPLVALPVVCFVLGLLAGRRLG